MGKAKRPSMAGRSLADQLGSLQRESAIVIAPSVKEEPKVVMAEPVVEESKTPETAQDIFEQMLSEKYWWKNDDDGVLLTPERRTELLNDIVMSGSLPESGVLRQGKRTDFQRLVDAWTDAIRKEAEPVIANYVSSAEAVKTPEKVEEKTPNEPHLEQEFLDDFDGIFRSFKNLSAESNPTKIARVLRDAKALLTDVRRHSGELSEPEVAIKKLQSIIRKVGALQSAANNLPAPEAAPLPVVESSSEVVEKAPENDARLIVRHGEQMVTILESMLSDYPEKHADLPVLVEQFGQALEATRGEFESTVNAFPEADTLREKMESVNGRYTVLQNALVIQSAEPSEQKEKQTPVEVGNQVATLTEDAAPVEVSNREVTTPIPAEPRVEVRPRTRKRRSLINAPKQLAKNRQKIEEPPELDEKYIESLEDEPAPVILENREEPITATVEEYDEDLETPIPPKKERKMRKPKVFEPWKPSEEEQEAAARIPLTQISPADHRPASYQETKSFRDHLKSGLGYILSRGEQKAEPEKVKTEPKISRAAVIATGLMDAMRKVAGVNILPDVVRYLPDKYFSRKERQEIEQAVMDMNSYAHLTNNPEIEAREERRFAEKRAALLERIEKSSFLTEDRRAKMLMRTRELVVHYETAKEGANQAYNRELAEIIGRNLETRRVSPDASEDKLAVLAGKYLGQGLNRISRIVGKLRDLIHEDSDGARAKESVGRSVKDGFLFHWKRVVPERVHWKRVGPPPGETPAERARNVPSALQKLSMRAGIAVIALGMPGKLDVEAFHTQVESLLAANESAQSSHLEQVATNGEELLAEASDSLAARVDVVTDEISAIEIPADFGEAIVKREDGITQALSRYVARNPHLYGYKGSDDDVARQRFATRFAVELTQKDGLLHTWLSAQAVRNIAILPIEKADGWHVAFIDAKTHETIEGESLKPFIEKEKKRTTTKPGA